MGKINVLCHVTHPCGLQRIARDFVRVIEACGHEVRIYDVDPGGARKPFTGMEEGDLTFFYVQPDNIVHAYSLAGAAFNSDIPHIACWYWETDCIPEYWVDVAQQYHVKELWAATPFIADAIKKRMPNAAVYNVLPYVHPNEETNFSPRIQTILKPNRFSFLYIFGYASIFARKNPLALAQAFRRTFKPDEWVQLIFKTMDGHNVPAIAAQLQAVAQQSGAPITICDEVFSYAELQALIAEADCYVSPHRSEGLGLTIIEAGFLEKPVIATEYSGNMAFMPCGYPLFINAEHPVAIPLGTQVYGGLGNWSTPYGEHLAKQLQWVFDNQAEAAQIGRVFKMHLDKKFEFAQIVDEVKGHLGRWKL